MSIRLGLQVPEYRYPGGPSAIFPALVDQARRAENSGFDTFFLMDHLIQVPGLGDLADPVLECYTTLAALAAATDGIQLGGLVTGNGYRNPALLAKMITTIDVISGGHAVLGLGAGWYEREHTGYGFEFPGIRERLDRLETSLQVVTAMLRDGLGPDGGVNSPRVRDNLPVLVGGSGEKRTFGLAAMYADHLDIECGIDELPRKLAAVDARCQEAGRKRSDLEVSWFTYLHIAADDDTAHRNRAELRTRQGFAAIPDVEKDKQDRRNVVGSPKTVAEILKPVLDQGVDGLVVGMSDAWQHPDQIELAGETLAALLG